MTIPGTDLPPDGTKPWGNPFRAAWDTLRGKTKEHEDVLSARLSARELAGTFDAILGRPFAPYLAALARRDCDILGLGDSKLEGQGASILSARWLDLFRDRIRAQYGLSGGYGYIPAWSSASGTPTGWSWTYGGTVTNSQQETGLGRHQVTLGSGGTAQITVDATSFKVFFGRKNTSADAVTIAIDGGAPVAYSVPGTAGGATTSGAVWVSPALTSGSHTVVITQTGGSVMLEGIMVYKGDEATGIRTWNGGHSGYYASYYTDGDGHAAKWQGMLPNVNPDLTVIAFGTNEFRTSPGRTPAQFKQDLKNLIAAVRTKSTTSGSFLIVMYEEPIDGGSGNNGSWGAYVTAAAEVAAEDLGGPSGATGVGLLDLTRRLPKATNPDTAFGLHTDGIHLNDSGNRFMLDQMMSFLTP